MSPGELEDLTDDLDAGEPARNSAETRSIAPTAPPAPTATPATITAPMHVALIAGSGVFMLTVLAPVSALINGRPRVSALVAVGSTNVVSVPATSGPLRFVSRSDGGDPEQALTMPASDVAITAAYETAIDARRREMGPSSFLGAPIGPELDLGAGRVRPYAGGDMYWSAGAGAHWVKGAIQSYYGATDGARRYVRRPWR